MGGNNGRAEYWLAGDHVVTLGESGWVAWTGSSDRYSFDYTTNSWRVDPELWRAFTGAIALAPLTKEQAKGVVGQRGGRWVDPPDDTGRDPYLDWLTAKMLDNNNAIPMPDGIDRIENEGTVVPFWITDDGAVLWTAGNERRVWRYAYPTNSWVLDPDTPPNFIGTPPTRPVTEEEARATIERNGGVWEKPISPFNRRWVAFD